MSEPRITDANAFVKPVIFRVCIGTGDNLHDFPDIINDHMKEFHFILGFVRDTYLEDGTGTGDFDRTWNVKSFSPQKVAILKKKHSNLKVVISIGGNGPRDQFNPKDNEAWIVKATSSIKEIILDYENEFPNDAIIDGIDINYGNITSVVNDFSYCIGQVIELLKNDTDVSNSISVVSIAPTKLLEPHYLKLYLDNKDNINWIDYKFYDQSFDNGDDVADLFKELISRDKYYKAFDKLLVGVSTYNATQTKILVDGCKYLHSRESLAGVFVWNAEASAPEYVPEGQIQELLTDY